MRHSLTALTTFAALAAAALPAHAADYVTEPTHTMAAFEISHFGAGINRARFDKEEGTIKFDAAAKTGSVNLTIDAEHFPTMDDQAKIDLAQAFLNVWHQQQSKKNKENP